MKVEKIKLTTINELNSDDKIELDRLDLTKGFVCDVETGICGPEKNIEENINIEEDK